MPRPRKTAFDHPIPVLRALRALGGDIQRARRRRRISTQLMAERASIGRSTLHKIEQGDPGVAIGNYAKVLDVLGMTRRLEGLVDSAADVLGLELQDEELPLRIRNRSVSRPGEGSD